MRTKNKMYYGYYLLFFVLVLYAAIHAAPAAAQTTGTAMVGMGIHGIVPGQVARFTVVNLVAPAACTVEIIVVGLPGNVLLDQRVTVPPGQARQVDFVSQTTASTTATTPTIMTFPTVSISPTAATSPTPVNGFSRTEFRGICRAFDVQSTQRCSMSLEIFDQTTGATSLFESSEPCRILNAQLLPTG